ncbi:MAG: hypothetical protein OXD38_04050, partial [Aestuariivita sp.]|nr:hypothetical protein [Aestuariivita sp.]
MNERTLFLAWQDKGRSKAWFPIGRLDADLERSSYRFRYIGGAARAQEKAGFPLLIEFPSLQEDYQSSYLFPLFQNRVMNQKRPDFSDYLHNLDCPDKADPIQILSVNGGRRVTDAYEVFPKISKDDAGQFTCRFFLHSWQRVSDAAQTRINELKPDEKLYLTLELTNPATRLAVQIQTTDYHMIGWAPRYLVGDLTAAMNESPEYSARVVRVNPQPAPSSQRVLIEVRGRWE